MFAKRIISIININFLFESSSAWRVTQRWITHNGITFCKNPGQTFGLSNKKQANLIVLDIMCILTATLDGQYLFIMMFNVFLSEKITMLCISALPLSFKYRYYNLIEIHCHRILQKDVRSVKMKASPSHNFLMILTIFRLLPKIWKILNLGEYQEIWKIEFSV